MVVACRACGMSVCMSVHLWSWRGRGCPSLSMVCREPCRPSVLACGDVTWRHVSGPRIYVLCDTPMNVNVFNGLHSPVII